MPRYVRVEREQRSRKEGEECVVKATSGIVTNIYRF